MSDTTAKVEFANTLRGFAALSVLISHYLGVFWLARPVVAILTNSVQLPQTIKTPHLVVFLNQSTIFGWGEFGVALFFLISGFVIPFSLSKLNGFQFILNRIFRIYPTYIIGFSITLLAIYCCGRYFQRPFPYDFHQMIMHYFPGLHDIFRTNIDGIIWTLDIEIKFYLLCALAVNLFKRKSKKIFLLPYILGLSTLMLTHKVKKLSVSGGMLFKALAVYSLTSQFLIFMFIGVVFHYIFKKLINAEHALFIILSNFLLFAVISHYSPYHTATQIWSYAFALVLFAFSFAHPRIFSGNSVVNYLADISYPLYVIHGVTGYAMVRILLDKGLPNILTVIITFILILTLATILHKIIERPSQEFGKKLAKTFLTEETVLRLKTET